MLAARDQENLIHSHQTFAAGKPLNQNIRALHPKTPGNLKTPFRPAKQDENRPIEFKGQKALVKDGPSKLEKGAFVTPLAPRNRAPLGVKTTNAKAQTFQTPAAVALPTKTGRTASGQRLSTARRSGRSKITVAPSEPVGTDVLAEGEEEPDFGYAPPPPVALPDPPLEVEEDPLLTEELRTGYGELYFGSPKDENGVSLRFKKEEEEHLKHEKQREHDSLKEFREPALPKINEADQKVEAMIAAGPKKTRPPFSRVDTMKARSAAAALSDPNPRLPAAAMKSTQASEQKKKGILSSSKPKPSAEPQIPSVRRPVHAAVSNNTIGFPKAKKAPSIIPKGAEGERNGHGAPSKPIKIEQASIHPRDFRDLYGSPPEESEMWFRLKAYELLEKDVSKDDGDDIADDLFEADFFPFENSKLDDDDFQLPMPE